VAIYRLPLAPTTTNVHVKYLHGRERREWYICIVGRVFAEMFHSHHHPLSAPTTRFFIALRVH
jgi:hypothetical protein